MKIDAEARREATRELAKSRRRGDYIMAGGGPATIIVDGKPMRPPLSEAERKAKERADFIDLSWRLGGR
jgi:hypothetical protein